MTSGRIALATSSRKFEVGEVVITSAAATALATSGLSLADLLSRHQSGDWGVVSEPTRAVNERGLAEPFNIQSIYDVAPAVRIVVATNRDRTLTMVHLDTGSG